MVISESNLLNKGTNEYQEKTEKELAILQNINAFPVQRNSGIYGFLKDHFEGRPVPVKIQGEYETIEDVYCNIKQFIEKVYNKKRLHSSIGYVPPNEFEQEALKMVVS